MKKQLGLTGFVISIALGISGCVLPGGAEPGNAVPLPTIDTSLPTAQPVIPTVVPDTIEETVTPINETSGGNKAGPGDIVFIREHRVWAIDNNGENERVLIDLVPGVEPAQIAGSPKGNYIAFVDAGVLHIINPQLPSYRLIEAEGETYVGPLVWTPDENFLYFQQLIIDPDTQVPVRAMIRRIPLPVDTTLVPESITEFDLSAGEDVLPVSAINDTTLVLQSGGLENGQYLLFETDSLLVTPILESYFVWDVSPDGTRILLYETADLLTNELTDPLPLYIADFNSSTGATNLRLVTSPDLTSRIQSARFSPNGQTIAATQTIQTNAGSRIQVVVFAPDGAGGFTMTVLQPNETRLDVAFAWLGDAFLVVERLPLFDAPAELWRMAVDGSDSLFLANGEVPVVIGGR